MKEKIIGGLVSLTLAASPFAGFSTVYAAETPTYQTTARQTEQLNRGLVATYKTEDGYSVLSGEGGVYLSWRLLGDESLTNQAFDIYRSTSENGTFTKIATTEADDPTNYTDTRGTTTNYYKVVKADASAADVAAETAVAPGENHTARASYVANGYSEPNSFTYVDIPIERPDQVSRMGDGATSYYYDVDSKEGGANDASVGDLDGDGDYEIVLKWDPTDSKDSAGADYTGNQYIDAYEIDPDNTGYKWRIDLGQNVTSGAHYTQFIVYDFDGDGKSEVAMKTAPGTIDGTGSYVSEVGDTDEIRNVDNNASFIGTSGRLKGKNPFTQYLTIFDGETGAALYTTEYIPYTTAENAYWGDGSAKYNRSERYLAGVAYLDGETPSLIMCRGYYADSVIRAYDWDGETLSLKWEHIGKSSASTTTLYGQGNHNLSIGDIDNDGKDEIVYGSAALDDDGETVLGNTYLGHGDAMHMSDFNNDGVQEVFSVKEEKYKTFAEDLRVASTGKHFWDSGTITSSDDNGRGVMDNIDDDYAKENSNALAIGWSSGLDNSHDLNGDDVAAKPSAGSRTMCNFLVYWDGDLGRELLDDSIIAKYDASDGTTTRFYNDNSGYSLNGTSANNYSKYTPSLTADLWGDWREEIIMPVNKSSSTEQAYLRIFTSTLPTEYRLTTLMHDSQYRMGVAWQNVGYNQPPHTSYYIGSAALATDDDGNTLSYLAPKTAYTSVTYGSREETAVTGISVDPSELNVEVGKTEAIKAEILPSDATKKSVTWTSSDTNVAKVANGIVTGVAEGTATITAISKGNTAYTATCAVTVYKTSVTGVGFDESEINLGVGCTKQLSAEVTPSNATDTDVTYSSSDETIATVDSEGTVTGVAEGAVYITAKTNDGGYTAKCLVTVQPTVSIDKTNDDAFTATGADGNTTITTTATSASIKHTNATSGASVTKSFTPYSDNKATLSFDMSTGGKQYDGTNWNWTDHEYSLYLKLLNTEGENIITLKQGYGDGTDGKAGNMTVDIAGIGETNISTWTLSGTSASLGNIQGSAKTWTLTAEFDYDSDTCVVTLNHGDGADVVTSDPFELNGASFETLEMATVVDGTGDIIAQPSLSNLAYTRITPSTGGTGSVLYSKGGTNSTWTEDDIADWTQTNSTTAALAVDTENNRLWYHPTQPSTGYSAEKTFDITSGAIVTYNIDWYFGNAVNRASSFEYLQIGDLQLGWTSVSGGNYYMQFSIDGGTTWVDSDEDGTADHVFTGANTTYTKNVRAVFDTSAGTVVLYLDGEQIYSGTYSETGGTTGADTVKFGFTRVDGTSNWEYPNGIASITVSQYIADSGAASAKITAVNFSDTDGTHEIADGVLTQNGVKYYGYKAELANYESGTITGTFVKKDDSSAVATITGDTTISGDAETVVYIVSNAELDTAASTITIQ